MRGIESKKIPHLPIEARKEAIRPMLSTYRECLRVLGEHDSETLICRSDHSYMSIEIYGKRWIENNNRHKDDEGLDLIVEKTIYNLDEWKNSECPPAIEKYRFYGVVFDDGHVIKELLDYTPHQSFVSIEEEAGKIELEELTGDIKEADEYPVKRNMRVSK
jgi:hypothetical protein